MNSETQHQWDLIDWNEVERRVNKLQSRIAKAVKEGKPHLARRLQHLLANSFYAKLTAVKRVTSNKGKKTPGIDRQLWSTPASKWKAAVSLQSKGYKSLPLRRVFIEKKGKNKKRPLGIPTMYDRAMQALYALTLDPIAETIADRGSFGFRKHRSQKDARQKIFICMSRKNSAKWVLEGDIKGCFDNISHEWLLENIPMDKRILKEFLKSGYLWKRELFPTKDGTPQGGIISPILANMTLDGIELMLKKHYWTRSTGIVNYRHNKNKVHFIRYADDFIVTAGSKEVAVEVREMINKFISHRGLELAEDKTSITHIQEGFDFLGWNARKYGDKLLIKPSKNSFKENAVKIRTAIKEGRAMSQEKLIAILNPIIRGWCNYHQSSVSKKMFQKMNQVIFEALWRWAKRRHPNKSKTWIKNRYWKSIGSRNWVFHSGSNELILPSDTKIVRHRMIKLNKNPYLSEDREYYA
ncbi:MAG: group II intron reverse transcriptase/maturase, partial [bacterium]|nr:group II intron reverse transcriptase/maturase [bacterium]